MNWPLWGAKNRKKAVRILSKKSVFFWTIVLGPSGGLGTTYAIILDPKSRSREARPSPFLDVFLVWFLDDFFLNFGVFFDVPDIEFVWLFTLFWALVYFSFFLKNACKNASKKHRKSMKNLEKIWYEMATSTGIIKISSFFGLLPLPRPIWSHFGIHWEAQNRRIMRQEQGTKKK